MSSFKALYTQPLGTFVHSDPYQNGDRYETILISPEHFHGEWHELLEDTFGDGGEELLEDPDYQLIGFFNVSHEEFNPEDGEVPPQFDAILFFRHSEGGEDGPVYALDVDGTAHGEPEVWAPSFEAVGFKPL